jgi:hypothetical protein
VAEASVKTGDAKDLRWDNGGKKLKKPAERGKSLGKYRSSMLTSGELGEGISFATIIPP